MAAFGLIFGLLLIVKLGREQGLDPDKLWNLGIIAILSGIFGAKILMVLVDFTYYRSHVGELFSFSTLQAGGVWSGGLLLALAMCIWYMRVNNMPVLRTCDVFAPGLRWVMPSAASDASPPAVAMAARPTCPGL